MSISSSVYRSERREISRRYASLNDADRNKLRKPIIHMNKYGRWIVTMPNFASQYSTSVSFETETDAQLYIGRKSSKHSEVTSWHWSDHYSEKDMLKLMNYRLGE